MREPAASMRTDPAPREPMRFAEHGAERISRAAVAILPSLERAFAELPAHRPGLRLHAIPALADLTGAESAIGQCARRVAGRPMFPVRAILFDKTDTTNWSLAWHQDRTINVRARIDVAGFGPWTIKAGLIHVAPPFAILAQMVTLRVHLDAVPPDNAPLLIAPGSHRMGAIREDRISAVVAQCGVHRCTASAGDVWAYATPILHASEAAATPRRRRVLQLDYAGEPLPGGLEWSGL